MSLVAQLERAIAAAGLPPAPLTLDRPRAGGGDADLATSVALTLAKQLGRPPLEVAAAIAAHVPGLAVAPPGFLNWTLPSAWLAAVPAAVAALEPRSGPVPFPAALETAREARAFVLGGPTGPVQLLRDGRPVQATWTQVLAELDADTARFWLQLRPAEASLDLDLAVAGRETVENPAFYVRHAATRAAAIARRAREEGLQPELIAPEPAARPLAVALGSWQDELARPPQRRARYAREIADAFHAYYASCRVFGDPAGPARLALVDGTARVLRVVLEEGLGVASSLPAR